MGWHGEMARLVCWTASLVRTDGSVSAAGPILFGLTNQMQQSNKFGKLRLRAMVTSAI
jgi:hypothetical protein